MPITIGVTSGGVLVPVRVDTNGVMIVDQVSALPAGDNNIGNVDIVTLPALVEGSAMIGKVQATNYGLFDGAAHKDPIRLGYSGDKTQQVSDTSAAAGSNVLTGSSVPAGEIWAIEAVMAVDDTNAITAILLVAVVNGISLVLHDQRTLVAGEPAIWTGTITLSQGDYLLAVLNGVTLNDDIYLRYHGRRIDIDQ